MIWIFLQLLLLATLLYYYINRKYSYWSSRGITGPRPFFPFGYTLSKAIHRPDYIELEWSKKYGPLYGVYTGLHPTLTVTDPTLIKQILVKDFNIFINRRTMNANDPIFNHNLFNLESEDWKRVRSIVSPAFTSGKLKGMYGMMNECIDRLLVWLERKAEGDGLVNTKEVISGFTIDVIASTGFATETDALSQNSPFVYHGRNVFNFNPLKVAAFLTLPRPILNLLGITVIFTQSHFNFFIDLTRKIVQQRKEQQKLGVGPKRNDLIQLMIDTYAMEADLKEVDYEKLTAKMDNDEENSTESSQLSTKTPLATKTTKTLNETEIIAQSLVFFFAGFETTASTLTHIIFEFAHNQVIQERLFEELTSIASKTDQTNLAVYFDKLMNHAPYLEAVVKEALRKYPPVIRIERRVGVNDFKLAGVPLEKDVLIEIPVYCVHHNADYYPEPERFNPDRFLPEYKNTLTPYTYLPFGDGPRNCIGMRFAYQEIKLCLARIIQQFKFNLAPSTPSRLAFAKGSPMLNTEEFLVKVSKR